MPTYPYKFRHAWIGLVLAALSVQPASAQIRVRTITSSAGFTPGLPFIGSLASIGLTGLIGIEGIQLAPPGLPLPYQLAGVSVLVNGAMAPILAVADMGYYQQINFQIPDYSRTAQPPIEVRQAGTTGVLDWASMPNANAGWGIFFEDQSGFALAQHADYSRVTADHPARPGEIIVIYCSNLADYSDVASPPAMGYPASAQPLPALLPGRSLFRTFALLKVNERTAEFLYVGLSPNSYGLFQINFRVPEDTPNGDSVLAASTDNSFCVGAGAMCPPLVSSRTVKLPVQR